MNAVLVLCLWFWHNVSLVSLMLCGLIDLVVVVRCSFAARMVLMALYRCQPIVLIAIVFCNSRISATGVHS